MNTAKGEGRKVKGEANYRYRGHRPSPLALRLSLGISLFCGLPLRHASATTAENYDPAWLTELGWAGGYAGGYGQMGNLFNITPGAQAYLEDLHTPWWQNRVANPADYDASKLPTGAVRLDSALMADFTLHRLLPGWQSQASPTNIDNVYTFTPGSSAQEPQTARSGQAAFFDLGLHPISTISADIGAELLGNYDQSYYFPVNDEHRIFDEQRVAKIVRGEVKYDDNTFMIRGFEAIPEYGWSYQNDLFQLLPAQYDTENYRIVNGELAPRGGEMRYKSPIGTLDLIGGTEIRWGYGSSAYAKYDLPAIGSWENSFVYRNENIPWGEENPDERRWSVSYNSSWMLTESIASHAGILYQPFRLDRTYTDVSVVSAGQGVLGSDYDIQQKRTLERDAFGGTWRVEDKPKQYIDEVGLGYTYLGPVAGDRQQVDVNADKTVAPAWNVSAAYMYRQPIIGPEPLLYEGTPDNPGAILASPRGPDDPFTVQWDNRKAHVVSLTLAFNPDPATPLFKFQKNVLEDWNINPAIKTPWVAAVQGRMAIYPTNTDRLYYYDEEHNLLWDPIGYTDNGALASAYPLYSGTALARWTQDRWRVTTDLSAGEAFAGDALAYTSATNFYKPSTIYISGGISVQNGPIKTFFRYGQDVWGPLDYAASFGWAYHRIYQAGISADFAKNAQVGFRYIGTRMTDEFIGSDMAAFNEFQFYLTYHFGLQANLGAKLAPLGHPLPQVLPEAALSVSDARFTPDGSGPVRTITLLPHASAEAGVLSWRLAARNSQGEAVRSWEGQGPPPSSIVWDGANADGKTVPPGTYRLVLTAVDLYGNEATAPAQPVDVQSLAPAPAAKAYAVTTTPEGLRVTLSSQVLFDFGKYNLKESAKDALDQIVQLLQAYPSNPLRIAGHTDNVGSNAYNQKLSERRARAVADYLLQHSSISKTRLSVVGYGKRRPIASNATEEGRQLNRRVEIDILK
jgi:outer membrane protein OmpA-like peptidoglycan-associated protein